MEVFSDVHGFLVVEAFLVEIIVGVACLVDVESPSGLGFDYVFGHLILHSEVALPL